MQLSISPNKNFVRCCTDRADVMQGDCGGLFIASPLENQIQRINATHMEHLLAGNCFTISESRRCACRYSSRREMNIASTV